jgi:hypothetical protein
VEFNGEYAAEKVNIPRFFSYKEAAKISEPPGDYPGGSLFA